MILNQFEDRQGSDPRNSILCFIFWTCYNQVVLRVGQNVQNHWRSKFVDGPTWSDLLQNPQDQWVGNTRICDRATSSLVQALVTTIWTEYAKKRVFHYSYYCFFQRSTEGGRKKGCREITGISAKQMLRRNCHDKVTTVELGCWGSFSSPREGFEEGCSQAGKTKYCMWLFNPRGTQNNNSPTALLLPLSLWIKTLFSDNAVKYAHPVIFKYECN